MARKRTASTKARALKAAAGTHRTCKYVLSLYVTGSTSRSARAISNIRKICEDHLEGRYELEVVDIVCNPTLAKHAEIVAAPTLIKRLPLPLRRFIGDMSQSDRILRGLDLSGATNTSRIYGE